MYASKIEAKDYSRQVMGIVRYARFGLGDRGEPELVIDVSMLGSGSTMGFQGKDLTRIVVEADVADVTKLKGRACVVHTDQHYCKFVKWHDA